MRVIYKGRGNGKTKLLIERSAAFQIPIVVRTRKSVSYILRFAKDLNLKIPEPLTVDDIRTGKTQGTISQQILIDDAEPIIEEALRCYLNGLEAECIALTNPFEKTIPEEVITLEETNV